MLKKIYGLPVFSLSFRIFFILASLAAITVVTLWVSIDFDYSPFYSQIFTASIWHGHEMIFGFTLALLVGFILTASSHWSGIQAFNGLPIFILSTLWILERILGFSKISFWPYFVLTSFFLPFFIILLYKQLGENKKNKIIFIPIFIMFFLVQKFYHLGVHFDEIKWINTATDWAIHLIKLVIIIVAGRIIPFFTMRKFPDIKLQIPSFINFLCIAPIFLLFIPKDYIRVPILLMVVNLILLFAHSVRFILWRPFSTYKVPILAILNSAQFWFLIYFAIEALSNIYPALTYTKVPLHAFATGVLGVFAVGMMNRVSLGHTGRNIKASKLMISAYLCVHIGALIRVFTPIITPHLHRASLHHSSGWWTLGFIFFLFEFTKILMIKRIDEKNSSD